MKTINLVENSDYYKSIDINENIYSEDFFKEFLSIQHNIMEMYQGTIRIDMKRTIWFDVFAFSYLLLRLKEASDKGINVIFDFDESLQNENLQFQLFMYNNGFSKIISEITKKNEMDLFDLQYIMDNMDRLLSNTSKVHTCIYPATIIMQKENIEEEINEINQLIWKFLQASTKKSDLDNIIYKSIVFLQETIGNVFEHAYKKEQKKYCLVYVRKVNIMNIDREFKMNNYIRDNENTLTNVEKLNINNYRLKIINQSGYLDSVFYEENDRILEIYVLDIGQGVLNSFNKYDPKDDRNILEYIFSEGMRSSKKGKTSYTGGLYMLNNLFSKDCDYIGIKSDYNWFRIRCKEKMNNAKYNYLCKEGIQNKNRAYGLGIFAGIGCSGKNYKEYFLKTDDKSIFQPIYTEKLFNHIKKIFNNICCVDKRITEKVDENYDKEILVILSEENSSKENIEEIIKKINSINSKSRVIKTLIIGDINSIEAAKYYMFFDHNEVLLDMVILITQTFETAVFTFKNNCLKFNRIKTIEYLACSESKIENSIIFYSYWLKIYDSLKVWNIISNEQKKSSKMYYINNEIIWGKMSINGYLDFSQICTIEVFRKLCYYQLNHIKAYLGDQLYFIGADRLTEDICDLANANFSNEPEAIKVRIGSIYVTGTSTEKDNNTNNIFYFFRHASTKEPVNYIFEWVKVQKYLDDNFPQKSTNIRYERVGRTPFIAESGEEFFCKAHYNNHKDVYSLEQSSLYRFLQEEEIYKSRVTKFGHFDLFDRHDFLYINIINLFYNSKNRNMAVIKDEISLWDYIICEFALALSDNICDKLFLAPIKVSNTFVKKINSYKTKYKRDSENGIIIYFPDFHSSVIVNEMKNIFNHEIGEKIISISPIIRQRVSSPLLVSPLLLENLTKKIAYLKDNNKKANVTIFISELISTRLKSELEHMLMCLGADKLKIICVIDRTRFSLGSRRDGEIKSFCRIDLPTSRNNNACLICNGIEKYHILSNKINSSILKALINRNNEVFNKIKSSDYYIDYGIEVKKIAISCNISDRIIELCNVYDIDNINIYTDFGLVLFSIESTVISLSSEFLLYCIEDIELDLSTKILLMCSQLIHFNSVELTEKVKISILEKLMLSLIESEKTDEYTGLAILILAAQSDGTKRYLYDKYASSINKINGKNLNLYLLLAEIYSSLELKVVNNELEFLIMKSNETIPNLLYGIFLHTNRESKHNHSRILIRLYDRGIEFAEANYIEALNAVEYLISAYNKLPNTVFNNIKEVSPLKTEVLNNLGDEKRILELIINEGIYPENISAELHSANCKMINAAERINEEIIVSTKGDIYNKIIRDISSKSIKSTHKGSIEAICVCKSIVPISRKWFYMYADIRQEIQYLMDDFRYAKDNKLGNVFEISNDDKQYSGIVKTEFKEHFVEVGFYNYIDDMVNLEEIIRKKESKYGRPSLLGMEQLNSNKYFDRNPDFEIIEKNKSRIFTNRTLKASIKIPYLDERLE